MRKQKQLPQGAVCCANCRASLASSSHAARAGAVYKQQARQHRSLRCPSYVPSFTFLRIARITTRTEQHQPIIIAPHESSALRKNTHITRSKLFSSCLIAASP